MESAGNFTWLAMFLLYPLVVLLCSLGGRKRDCGVLLPFIIGLFLTPLASLIILALSSKSRE
jgi:hypothetical protein